MLKRFSFLLGLFFCGVQSAFAGAPKPWQTGFQQAASPVMEKVIEFHNLLLVVIFGIGIFVFLLLVYTCVRFRAKKNPVPSKVSHHTMLETVWTLVPVLILIVIAVPSVKLIYFMEKVPNADMTVKVISSQWYWTYEYPDHKDIKFDSYLIEDKDLKPGQLRLLEVDNRLVLPINTKVRVLLTSQDVIHSWAVPALGVKKDCVPGRTNETWLEIKKEGVYYGQCSELCGPKHGFMPIAIEAVSPDAYKAWVESKTKKEEKPSLKENAQENKNQEKIGKKI